MSISEPCPKEETVKLCLILLIVLFLLSNNLIKPFFSVINKLFSLRTRKTNHYLYQQPFLK